MSVYTDLDEALSALKASHMRLQQTMNEVRAWISNDSMTSYQLGVIAIAELKRLGYEEVSDEKLQQWGVFNCNNVGDVLAIIREVVEHRKNKAVNL